MKTKKKWRFKQSQMVIDPNSNKVYIPSYPDNYNMGFALIDEVCGNNSFYFREVYIKYGIFTKSWVVNGNIWQPKCGEFKVVNNIQAENHIKTRPWRKQ